MALQATDLFIVERAGVRYKMTADQIADFVGAVRDHTASDITDRNDNFGAAPTVKEGDRIFVTDATADPDVDAGWAIYRVQSLAPAVYEKIQEAEGLDLVIAGTDLGFTAAPSGGTLTSSTGSDVSIPDVDATNAGLATPGMLANSHVAATAGEAPGTNPVTVTAGQAVAFNITQLAALP